MTGIVLLALLVAAVAVVTEIRARRSHEAFKTQLRGEMNTLKTYAEAEIGKIEAKIEGKIDGTTTK